MINSKQQLEVSLSKLNQVNSPKVELEQYPTPSNIAAEVLWSAYMNNDIKNKIVADLGCGNGILGIGASLLGAKKIFFLDSDPSSLLVTKKNFNSLNLSNAIFLREDVKNFKNKVDTVIQNPPFGVQNEHADREFLLKAFEISNRIYSFHKLESKSFIEALIRNTHFKLKEVLKFDFPLKKSQEFHEKKLHLVQVGCFILQKT
ncbi:methyltransferase [Candidatus Woesearchaeota archaeon]|nr:methyltransferase [Candidatus Woesearchaeota archaeon]